MSNLAPQSKYSLESFISPESSISFLGFVLINTCTALIPNLFSSWDKAGYIGLAGITLTFIYWFILESLKKRRLNKLALSVIPQEPQPARGLILLLSPYSQGRNSKIDPGELQNKISYILRTPIENLVKADFEAIELFNSNLVPQIKAVEYHLQERRLRDIWLITTKVEASALSATILEQYLRFQYGTQLKVYSQSYCIDDWNYKQLCELGEKIFRESGYKDEAISADITGGTKMMSVALAMACLRPGRRMQYMQSQRDWQGNPLEKGVMTPVGIDVFPILYQ